MSNFDDDSAWTQVSAVYGQMLRVLDSQKGPSARLAGTLAYRLGRVFAQYDRREKEFLDDLFDCIARIEDKPNTAETFRELYYDKRFRDSAEYENTGPKHRARPFEAAVETVRRIILTNAIRDALSKSQISSAGILGGSVSYGRFYNTKGAGDPSDIDLLLVCETYDAVADVAESLQVIEAFDSAQLSHLADRSRQVRHVLSEHQGRQLTVSHTLLAWNDPEVRDPIIHGIDVPQGYKVQLHIFDRESFSYLLAENLPTFIGSQLASDYERRIYDYREDRPHRGGTSRDICFASFSKQFTSQVIELPSGGFLCEESIISVFEERLYPGMYLNLLMPQFELRWDTTDWNVGLQLRVLKNKLIDRLTFERQVRPWEDQAFGSSHVRSENFSPHIWRRMQNSTGDLL